MIALRRYLVLVALFFWQGGFTFYAAVVVPVGTSVLRSDRRQGFITRRVTHYLNLTGAIALVPVAWDVLARRDRSRARWRACALLVALMALCQAGLFPLHAHLDGMMDSKGLLVSDPVEFRQGHRAYLWIHTFQWLFGLVLLPLTLVAWRAADRYEGATTAERGGAEGGVRGQEARGGGGRDG